MEAKLCQSCGMPLSSAEVLGTNADGSLNEEYCTYCYQHGDFAQDCTMDEMIEHCAQFTDEFNKDSGMNFTKEEAIAGMKVKSCGMPDHGCCCTIPWRHSAICGKSMSISISPNVSESRARNSTNNKPYPGRIPPTRRCRP